MIEEYKIQKGTLTAIADKFRDILRSFKEDIGANGLFNSDAVTVYYIEYVDYSEQYDTLSPVKTMSDKFVAYDFIEDNNGKVTPVIYRIDSESERYADIIDYGEPYFYIDQAEIDGVLYDKWRKIEPGDENFGWDGSSKKYVYTNIIISNDKYSPTDFPTKIDEVYEAGVAVIPDGYVKPEGDITLTSNGSHDVSGKATAIVDVQCAEPHVITVDTLPTTDIDKNAVYRCGGKLYRYEPNLDDSIVGMWVFDSVVDTKSLRSLGTTIALNFFYIDGNEVKRNCSSIVTDTYGYASNITYYMRYHCSDNDTDYEAYYRTWNANGTITDGTWNNECHKTIHIIDDSNIDKAVIEWLKANATNPDPSYAWFEYLAPEGSLTITENGTHDVTEKASVEVNVPIPSGYIKPSGTATITTNNSTTDITSYASVKVAISEYKGAVVIE